MYRMTNQTHEGQPLLVSSARCLSFDFVPAFVDGKQVGVAQLPSPHSGQTRIELEAPGLWPNSDIYRQVGGIRWTGD